MKAPKGMLQGILGKPKVPQDKDNPKKPDKDVKEDVKPEKKDYADKTGQENPEEFDIKKFFIRYKPTEEVKLTIFMVENTPRVVNEYEKLTKIARGLITEGYVILINYGSTVEQTEPFKADSFDYSKLVCTEKTTDSACLYDTLSALENIVTQQYNKKTELDDVKEIITKIEVIGIGNCIDNCSRLSQQTGINCFSRIVSKPNITTKYFGITEDAFIPAATVGFRSIGAIIRNFGNE